MMTQPRRGRHRAPSRWARYQPTHGDNDRGILSMLLPSWKFDDDRRRPTRGHVGTHREELVIDDRSGPTWDVDEPSVLVDVADIDPPIDDELDLGSEFEAAVGLDTTTDSNDLDSTDDDLPESMNDAPPVIDLIALEQSTVDQADLLPYDDTEPASSSLAALLGFSERQVSFTDHIPQESPDTAWETLPTLEDVALDDDDLNTGSAIQRLWDATEEHTIVTTPLDDPIEAPQARLIDSRRFRRSAVLGLVVITVLAAWAIRTVSDQPERAAIARETAYRAVGEEIRNAIGPIGSSTELLTREDIAASDFSDLTAALDVLDGVARRGAGIAAEPLPRSLPVGSSLALDELVLPQSLLEQASTQALNLEERIGDAITYRLIFANAFDLPPLPTRATLLEIGDLGAELSVSIAQTEQVLADLPADTFFGAHRQDAFDRLARITDLQVPYFEALREEDESSAAQVRAEILGLIEASRTELAQPLRTSAQWADAQVTQLRSVLDELAARTAVD